MDGNMRAAVLHRALDLRIEEVGIPAVGSDDALIRISTNGICGSDLHFYEDGRLGPFTVSKPYIPGHEACGTVVSSENPSLPKGQRVVIEPGIPCRRCRFCKSGRYNLCRSVRFLSAPPENGTLAEYVVVPWDFAHPIPDTIDDEGGAFIEPVSVGVQACERAGLTAGATIAIIGAGPIGLILSLVARSYGATCIFAVDVLENRLNLASRIGADAVFDATKPNLVGKLADASDGGVDVVFDASGSSVACAGAPEIARPGGVIALVGWPETAEFPFPIEMVLEKELDVRGINRYCNAYPKAISLMAKGLIDPSALVSHRFAFDDVVEAFSFSSKNRKETTKVMVIH